ncbi:hypothetical protein BJ322DRAFT_423522 [Thelephora terrestris]|uniref:Uncharacterized protein n=1 Tax=Thelephora terrestris TaxID=56493 RepID=A0A9P6HNL6_9AGAM|nr:hypothetical protein BJ322DRAFT_423522 [Thelephora terrestris]
MAETQYECLEDSIGEESILAELAYLRFIENITIPGLPAWTCIPQRLYCRGPAIQNGRSPQKIMFVMADGAPFPAKFALAGQRNLLMNADDIFLTSEQSSTTHIQIEWPGYDGWGAKMRNRTLETNSWNVTRAKLVIAIAMFLRKFIEEMQSTPVNPADKMYEVGPGGIELGHIHIDSLEQVGLDSWQPVFIYSGP